MSKCAPKNRKSKLTDRAFARKMFAANKALHEGMNKVFAEVLGEWDRDVDSTVAHLAGLHDALACAVGAVTAGLGSRLSDMEAVGARFIELGHKGYHTDIVRTFRQKKRKQKKVAGVIALPVVRR